MTELEPDGVSVTLKLSTPLLTVCWPLKVWLSKVWAPLEPELELDEPQAATTRAMTSTVRMTTPRRPVRLGRDFTVA